MTARISFATQSRKKWIIAASVALLALAVDLITKAFAEANLPLGEYREILPFFGWQRTMNTGAAFGLLSGNPVLILIARVAALSVVAVYLFMETRPVLSGIAAGLLVGGSLGNIANLVTQGYVTDFLKLPYWPNFNLADVFIIVGTGLVLISLFFALKSNGPERAEAAEGAEAAARGERHLGDESSGSRP